MMVNTLVPEPVTTLGRSPGSCLSLVTIDFLHGNPKVTNGETKDPCQVVKSLVTQELLSDMSLTLQSLMG